MFPQVGLNLNNRPTILELYKVFQPELVFTCGKNSSNSEVYASEANFDRTYLRERSAPGMAHMNVVNTTIKKLERMVENQPQEMAHLPTTAVLGVSPAKKLPLT